MNKRIKNNFRHYIINMFLIISGILLIFSSNFIIMELGQSVKNINYAIILQENINKKNLTLPFPKSNSLDIQITRYDHKTEIYLTEFIKPINEFQKVLSKNYYYSIDYDCKYWAYVWTLYWKSNRIKNNWKLNYLTTDNHVLVMVYNESGYIIMDGENYKCYGEIC